MRTAALRTCSRRRRVSTESCGRSPNHRRRGRFTFTQRRLVAAICRSLKRLRIVEGRFTFTQRSAGQASLHRRQRPVLIARAWPCPPDRRAPGTPHHRRMEGPANTDFSASTSNVDHAKTRRVDPPRSIPERDSIGSRIVGTCMTWPKYMVAALLATGGRRFADDRCQHRSCDTALRMLTSRVGRCQYRLSTATSCCRTIVVARCNRREAW
jgi:hypothetical protein